MGGVQDDGIPVLDTLVDRGLLQELGAVLPLEKLSHLALACRRFAGALEPLVLEAYTRNLAGVALDLVGATGRAWSAEDAHGALLGFHAEHIERRRKDGGERDDFQERIRETACKVLADPRGVLRSDFVTLLGDTHYETFGRLEQFLQTEEGELAGPLQRSLADHAGLLYKVFVPIARALATTRDALDEDEKWARLENRRAAKWTLMGSGQAPKDCSFEQRERFRALGRELCFGGLNEHPSVLFLKGWLIYKGGALQDLSEAVPLLRRAQAGNPILAQTCRMLVALAKFHMVRLVDAEHPKSNLLAAQHLVASLAPGPVMPGAAQLFRNGAAEFPLVSEVLGAVSVCLSNLCAASEHSAAVCRRAIEVVTASQSPGQEEHVRYPKMVVLAARVHLVDIPGPLTWEYMDKTSYMSTARNKKPCTRMPRVLVIHRPDVFWDDWSLSGDDGFMPYETCCEEAVRYNDERYTQLLQARAAVGEAARDGAKRLVHDMLYEKTAEKTPANFSGGRSFDQAGRGGAPSPAKSHLVCQVCGVAAPYRCTKCKAARYCSTKCSGYDWGAAHKQYMHKQ